MTTDIRFLFVHKGGAHDPGLQAMLRWLPRIIPHYYEFVIDDAARGKKSADTITPLSAVIEAIGVCKPTHILTWVPLFNEVELQFCHERGIYVLAVANSFVSLSSGIFKDQLRFLNLLAQYDAYFIPHAPHVRVLRRHGVSAFEMPFFYDPEVYFPRQPSLWRRWLEREYPVLFIGSVMEPGAENRIELLTALACRFPVYVVTYQRPSIPGIHWLGVANSEKLINRLLNRSVVVLGSDFVTDRQLDEFNGRIENLIEPYTDRFTLRVRVATTMGSGACYAVEDHEEMARFAGFEKAWIPWSDVSEAVDRISMVLRDREERVKMANLGWQGVNKRHSVDVRIHEMVAIITGGGAGDATKPVSLI